jgi:eukaryotic-like serine/threonine-protein kinase
MEYFPSRTLAQLLDRGDQGFVASYQRILDLYQQVVAGVEYLHSLGMSHGDIKPQNILVSGDRLKLTDFGSSILPEDIYARTRENGGTILYSAPEVGGTTWRGRECDELFRADVYSLGVLLYHLITSRLPHDTLSQVARHTPFPRPREVNTSVSPSLEEFVLRCLTFNPQDRWTSVREMEVAFRSVRRAQLDYHPVRTLSPKRTPLEDWSSQATRLIQDGAYGQAENVAHAEFGESRDPHAFLVMVTAAFHDGRYFDCIREIETYPEMLGAGSPMSRELQKVALSSYLETRQIDQAERALERTIVEDGETVSLLLKKASILGLQARYEEASKTLLSINREYPNRAPVLKRLVLVFEQLRDLGKAVAFLKAYLRLAPTDQWAEEKLRQFQFLGFR